MRTNRYLTSKEELLVELVHFLAFGTELEHGMTHKEIRDFLVGPIKKKGNRNPLELIEAEGLSFLKEVRAALGEDYQG